VFIAPAGEQILREMQPRNEELTRRLLEPLPAEHRPLFVKSLRLLAGVDPGPAPTRGENPDRPT